MTPTGMAPEEGPSLLSVMAMRGAGKPLREMRAAIDAKYGKSGPSTPTPQPSR